MKPVSTRRRRTRRVAIGDIGIGGSDPVRVQSMTTPATTDVAATVAQVVRLVDAGCEIVRLTVPTRADAEALPEIRRRLASRRVSVPLVADIHFTPAVAMLAVEHVEKIRINPGNFADKKRFATREYTDPEYAAEIERIERIFRPLVVRCRDLGVAMRIGTNHGSLSDRILNRFGDTPEGMVESALEFVRICEAHRFREIVLSMKASNPVVVLRAYRLLAARMDAERMDYPIHLGVTEAGDGEDGRVKSAVGIGALLEEGIGDTVRVSLTEDPVHEIPVARELVRQLNDALARGDVAWIEPSPARAPAVPDSHRRSTRGFRVGPRRIGADSPVLVEVPLESPLVDDEGIRREMDAQCGARVPEETRAELVSVRLDRADDLDRVERLRAAMELVAPRVALSARIASDLLAELDAARRARLSDAVDRVHVRVPVPLPEGAGLALRELIEGSAVRRASVLVELVGLVTGEEAGPEIKRLARLARETEGARLALAADTGSTASPLFAVRGLVRDIADLPVVLVDRPVARNADETLGAASTVGGLLCEGIGDAVHVEGRDADSSRRLAFGILQAARVRMTRTEFISCPSCGRTLFDLEETTARIKRRTSHLKGVKIAVMGCIVNGPGEMADADFGYVGWGEGKIALFVGKELVEKDIPTDEADERLVDLIRRSGRWVDPETVASERPS